MVNQLPQGWKEEELGKLADVIAGQSPEGIYYNTVGEGMPFYQGKSEFQEMYLGNPTKWTTKVTKLAKKNDILMSVRAPVGPVNITQEDICIGRGLAAITAKSTLLQLYLFYHLRYLEDKISGTNGAVFASISKREIEQIKITYPTDKEEQDYIVKTLDAVAEMIKLRKETIQLTKDLIPAIFQEMFGDPVINPKGWEMQAIKENKNVVSTGRTPPTKYNNMFGGGIPFITPGDLDNDQIVSERTLTEEGAKYSRLVRAGATLVCCIGNIGKTNITSQISAFNQQINAIEWNNEYYNDIFGVHLLKLLKPIFNSFSGAVVPILNKSSFESIKIIRPPLSLQKEFADKVEQINQNLEVQQKDLDRLQELFDQLLQKTFTGELTRGEDYGKH